MSYADLLERMQSKDPEAFLEMTERYGWAVYSAIRQKHPDQVTADRIYDATMNSFYNHLARYDAGDPLEALLCAFAEHVSTGDGEVRSRAQHSGDMPAQIPLRFQELPERNSGKSSGTKRFWMLVVILLIIAVLLALLWLTAGVMMAMEYIPFYDLGYSWFDANIFDFF